MNKESNIYGLYEIVSHRFFFVSNGNVTTLKELVKLFSSRCTLKICLLNTAKNYTSELIDNQNCGNWTMSNQQDIIFTKLPMLDNEQIVNVNELLVADPELPWNFFAIQNYLLFAYRQILKVEYILKTDKNRYQSYSSLPDAPFKNQFDNFKKSVYEILYKELDFEQARLKINHIIEKYEKNKT